jgi:hypothetical protein
MDLVRRRAEFLAENALLRQQVIVAQRRGVHADAFTDILRRPYASLPTSGNGATWIDRRV